MSKLVESIQMIEAVLEDALGEAEGVNERVYQELAEAQQAVYRALELARLQALLEIRDQRDQRIEELGAAASREE